MHRILDRKWLRRVTCGVFPLLGALAAGAAAAGQSGPAVGRGGHVITLTDTLPAAVGGVTVDAMGMIYVADFRETVWKVTPDGQASVFATGLYGASGNAIDSKGNLLQSNFYGNYITRIDRHGDQEVLAEGLVGPVGIAMDGDDNLYVCNCRNNTLAFVTNTGEVSKFAESDLFKCPNGITRDQDGTLYVVNFGDELMLKVTPDGSVSRFARLPGGGNGHVTLARGYLYATSFRGNRIYRVSLDGEVELIAGTGAVGEHDGPALEATFTLPNGIAAGPQGDRLYVNDYINRVAPTTELPPQPKSLVRQIKLPSVADVMLSALQEGGIEAMVAAYHDWKADPATAGTFTEVEVNLLGYQLMNGGSLPAAIEVFKLNVEAYPNSWNVYDSLGEAYMNAGQKELAISNYEKSLQLNPANQNATAMLEKLRQSGG